MPLVPVVFRWNGKDIDLEVNIEDSVEVVKTQLFTMTNVTPDRQKLLFKGRVLTEDTELDTLNIKEGSKFMMLGSVDGLPREPENKTVFLEDMSDKQLAETLKLPSGLQNLGNTCYLNSTLQCLRAIPELQESLNRFTGGQSGSDSLTASLRDLYRNLGQTTEGYAPLFFLQMLRNAFPLFAQRNPNGYLQQDAEECWTQIVTSLKQSNIPVPGQDSNLSSGEASSSSTEESFIDRYMTGEFTSTLKCIDAPEEKEVIGKENFLKLNCHISVEVNYVQNGIVKALDERLEKTSPTLGRMAHYTKTSRISRLPSYLTIQFVRFFWKSETGVKAKILRKVKFPMELDVTEFCTDELKNKILPLKHRLAEYEKEKASLKQKAKREKVNNDQAVEDSAIDEPTSAEELEELKKLIDPDLSKDVGANVSGLYDLCAVLTHIGRSAESGHYIGWVRKEDSDDWIKYDDDRVTIVPQEDVQKLEGSGGGDWHIAYILLYKSKKIA